MKLRQACQGNPCFRLPNITENPGGHTAQNAACQHAWRTRGRKHAGLGCKTKSQPVRIGFLSESMVGAAGFELATPCTPCKCTTRLRYAPTEERIIAGFLRCASTFAIFLFGLSFEQDHAPGGRPAHCLQNMRSAITMNHCTLQQTTRCHRPRARTPPLPRATLQAAANEKPAGPESDGFACWGDIPGSNR